MKGKQKMKNTITEINARIAQLKSEIFINQMSDFLTWDQQKVITNHQQEIEHLKNELRVNYPEWQAKVDEIEKLVYKTCWDSEFRRWNWLEKHSADLIAQYNEYDSLEDFLNMLFLCFNISCEIETQETKPAILTIKPTPNRRFCNQYTIEIIQ